MGNLTLILGGARSGKSAFAQQLAQELGGEGVLYVATAQALDEEMQERIEKHRQERPASWCILETHRNVGQAILEHHGNADVILLDCLTVLISNLLMDAEDDPFDTTVAARVDTEINEIVACVENLSAHLIVVSNEVGMGLVPPYPMGRAYRDLLGRANQALARKADTVYLLVAGIPWTLKETPIRT
jgi:adenosylcobinamide kinase/adenosylcobinamide-phosphate guanylyltransferase